MNIHSLAVTTADVQSGRLYLKPQARLIANITRILAGKAIQSTTVKSPRKRYNIKIFCEKHAELLVRLKSMCSLVADGIVFGLVSRSTAPKQHQRHQLKTDHHKYVRA
jgi:hypothetical protein